MKIILDHIFLSGTVISLETTVKDLNDEYHLSKVERLNKWVDNDLPYTPYPDRMVKEIYLQNGKLTYVRMEETYEY